MCCSMCNVRTDRFSFLFFLIIQVKNFRADELMEFYKVSNRLRLFCYLTFELAIHSSINYCHIW